MAAVQEVMRGRTTLVIAHRLATIQNATRILVLRDGRIEEQGPFPELIAAGGSSTICMIFRPKPPSGKASKENHGKAPGFKLPPFLKKERNAERVPVSPPQGFRPPLSRFAWIGQMAGDVKKGRS